MLWVIRGELSFGQLEAETLLESRGRVEEIPGGVETGGPREPREHQGLGSFLP